MTFLPYSRLVSTLISYGADIKSRNYVLWTPLDCAAAYGQQKCAKILLDANADINPMDRNKVTPLHLAASCGHYRIVKSILDQRPEDVMPRDRWRNTEIDTD